MSRPVVGSHRGTLEDRLVPDIDPAHIRSAMTVPVSPERLLLVAVLERAVNDLLYCVTDVTTTREERLIRAEVHAWFHDRRARGWGCAYICEALGIDHEWFLAALAKRRRRGRAYTVLA